MLEFRVQGFGDIGRACRMLTRLHGLQPKLLIDSRDRV